MKAKPAKKAAKVQTISDCLKAYYFGKPETHNHE
jgi:hypothetical protein